MNLQYRVYIYIYIYIYNKKKWSEDGPRGAPHFITEVLEIILSTETNWDLADK